MRNQETGSVPREGNVRVDSSQVEKVYRQAANDFHVLVGKLRSDAQANLEPLVTEFFTALHSIHNMLVSIDSRTDSASQTLEELADQAEEANDELVALTDLVTTTNDKLDTLTTLTSHSDDKLDTLVNLTMLTNDKLDTMIDLLTPE